MDPPIDTFMTGIMCLQANLCIQLFKALKKVQIVRNIYIYFLFIVLGLLWEDYLFLMIDPAWLKFWGIASWAVNEHNL